MIRQSPFVSEFEWAFGKEVKSNHAIMTISLKISFLYLLYLEFILCLICLCPRRKGGVWQVTQRTDVRNKLILLTSRKGRKHQQIRTTNNKTKIVWQNKNWITKQIAKQWTVDVRNKLILLTSRKGRKHWQIRKTNNKTKTE